MCLGIPMQIVGEAGPVRAVCEHEGRRVEIDMSLVGRVPRGTWVMTFLGAAREVMDADAAHRSLGALAALNAIMSGAQADIDAAFADLVGREPKLPEHLRMGAMNDD